MAFYRDLLKWIQQEHELDYFSGKRKALCSKSNPASKQSTFHAEKRTSENYFASKTLETKILPSKALEPKTLEPETPSSKPLEPKSLQVAPQKSPAFSFQSMKDLMERVDATLEITPNPLNDQIAKKKSHLWKYVSDSTQAIILCNKQSEKKVGFLQNLSTAIQIYFFSCGLLNLEEFEQENDWPSLFSSENLKLILMFEDDIKKSKNLLGYYKEHPQDQTQFLGKIPCFILSSFKTYIEDPTQKQVLWKMLCQKIRSL